MRIQLTLERFILIDQIGCPQHLVFDQHPSALPVQVHQITAACNDNRNQPVTQRMQIMVQAGIDGWDIKVMMQPDKTLPQQTAANPCNHK